MGVARVVRVLVATSLAAGTTLGLAGPAAAHAEVVSTDPADGAVLDAVPASVTVTLDEDVLDTGAALVVVGPAGDRVDAPSGLTVEGPTVTVPIAPDAGPGSYQARFRVVSDDAHVVTGSFAFTVRGLTSGPDTTPTPTASASDVAADDTPASALPVGVLLSVLAVAVLALVGVLWLARRSRD